MIAYLIFSLIMSVLIGFVTLQERKIMASCQRRLGPETIGYLGLLTPIFDGIKLNVRANFMTLSFQIGVFIMLNSSTAAIYLFMDSTAQFSQVKLFGMMAFSELGLFIATYNTNNIQAYISAVRCFLVAVAMELVLGVFIILYLLLYSDTALYFKGQKFFISQITVLLFCLTGAGRVPSDMAEAESELVAGTSTEMSGVSFVMFSLSEYLNVLLYALQLAIVTFKWFNSVFYGLLFMFYLRSTLSRSRYDQIMSGIVEYIYIILCYAMIL